jgi:HD superfamily phosphohydrolase
MAIIFFPLQIVANKTSEIDVDKMDYFARDCHGLGMKSDFDHLRYIQNCRVMIIDDEGKERSSICIRDKVKNEFKNNFRKIII